MAVKVRKHTPALSVSPKRNWFGALLPIMLLASHRPQMGLQRNMAERSRSAMSA
jgi:hypothetical protein